MAASARGKAFVYNGERLEYWEKAFQAIDLTVTREARPLIEMALDASLKELMTNPNLMDLVGETLGGALATMLGGDSGLGEVTAGLVTDLAFSVVDSFPSSDGRVFAQAYGPILKEVLKLLPLFGFV
jgi:hypothetical protein